MGKFEHRKSKGTGGKHLKKGNDQIVANTDFFFKLLLIGDGAVGKTALAKRYLTGLFTVSTKITIGADFYSHNIEIGGNSVTLQIWDFGGEEQFRIFLPAYCKGARGAIFLFDVTNPSTLYDYDAWLSLVRIRAPNVPVLAVGTKIDLIDERKVSPEQGEEYTRTRGAQDYLEVSSKTGSNVNLAFERITKIMLASVATEGSLVQSPLLHI